MADTTGVLNGRDLETIEFEGCVFKHCDFSNSNFSNNTFIDCEFIDCNLSMLQLGNTSLQSVTFQNCKVLGIQFQGCTDFLFQVNFEDCNYFFESFMYVK